MLPPDCKPHRPEVAGNYRKPSSDQVLVRRDEDGGRAGGRPGCRAVQEALSAGLDGEDPGLAPDVVASHVEACAGCRGWEQGAAEASRRLRVRPAPAAVDLAPAVLAALRSTDVGIPTRRWTRLALLVTALLQLAVCLPALLGADDSAVGLHVTREVAAAELALAVGLLCAAWRPWRAAGMLPVMATLGLGLSATTLVDVLAGHVPPVDELPHLLALAAVTLLWRLRHGGGPGLRADPPTPLLRSAA
jgi:predicted anti-sigma-YlaC factor YlaD